MEVEMNVQLAALKAVVNRHGGGSIGGMSANLADDVLAALEAGIKEYIQDFRNRHPEFDSIDL